MDEQERDYSRIAYYLAKSTSCYLGAVVTVESGKDPEQRLELSDNEKFVANMMLIIAVNRVSSDLQQNPSVVHLLALEEFWKGIYSDEEIKSLQNEMQDKFNGLRVNDKDVLEIIGNLFCELGQHNDTEIVEELGGRYRLWVRYALTRVPEQAALSDVPGFVSRRTHQEKQRATEY